MAGKSLADRPLLFVSSDPSEGGTIPHRRAIYQHVQLKYAKWKRGEKARGARPSRTVPIERVHDQSTRFRSQLFKSTSDTSEERSSDVDPVVRSEPNIGRPRQSPKYSTGPVTVLQSGNSDPFDTLAIPVNPKTNSLMQFSRDYYLPGIQRDVNNPGQKIVGPEWIQCIAFLQDEGLAYSHFARMAALIASDPMQSDISGEFRVQALVFKSKGMLSLRKKVIEDPSDPGTYNQILLLMNAEIFDRNFKAAAAHASILANLLQDGIINDLPFLFKVVYHDAQRAAMSLTRHTFDLEYWVPSQLISMDDIIAPNSPTAIVLGPMGCGLDFALDSNPSLKHTMSLFKRNCLSLMLALKDKARFADRNVLFYGRFYMALIMGRFVNHYVDAVNVLNERNSNWVVETTPNDEARMSTYISLTALLLLRCLTRIDSVKITGNITIFNANMLIMHRLKETLLVVDGISRTDRFANARLYALFIGAWLEQARAALQRVAVGLSPIDYPSSGAELGWFNCELTEQARAMKVYEWIEVRKILQQFIYTDAIEPNGAHWFPLIMQLSSSHAF